MAKKLTLLLLAASLFCQAQIITTIAGTGIDAFRGDGGPATEAWIQRPGAVIADGFGNLYVGDTGNFRVRKINSAGIISTVAGNGTLSFSGDGGPGSSAGLFPDPPHQGLAVDAAGNLYIADYNNFRIRKVDPAGIITTVAGASGLLDNPGPRFAGDGGPATAARMNTITDVAVDSAGNIYIADSGNGRVRKVDTAGIITTVAGNGLTGFSGDGGPATSAGFAFAGFLYLAVDNAGNLFIADASAFRVRKVDSSGIITTYAGNGTPGFSGDGGPATSAQLLQVGGITVDSAGTLFIADDGNNRIRKVTTAGIISTVAGAGRGTFGGDGGPAISAEVSAPRDVAVDAAGNLYIADRGNHRIRKIAGAAAVTQPPVPPAITSVANAVGGAAQIAPNTWVEIKGTNLARNTRIWRDADFASNQLPTQLDGVSVTVNGKAAYVYYISPTQVNILTPPDILPASAPMQLTSGAARSAVANVASGPLSPAFFVFDATHVAATHVGGSYLGPTSLYPGLSTPAKPGETVILYANGFGPTLSPVTPGSLAQGGALPALPVVRIGGIPAPVAFAGLVSPGLYQFNVVVPDAAPDGEIPLTAAYAGLATQAGVVLTVQR